MSILKRGNRYWIDFRHNRVRYRKPSPDNTLAGAKVYEALIRQKLARGESVALKPEKKPEVIPSFKEFSDKWFEVYVKTNNKYSETLNKESVLRAHLNPAFGDKPLNKITNLDVESYKAEKIKAGQSHKSINNHLIVLSKCLNVAKEWEVISSMPKVKLLKVPPQKFDFLTTDECQKLLDSCEGLLFEMILFGLKTGLRFGELIALKWEDINLKGLLATVQRSIARGRIGSTKSNKIRHIPLLNDISEMLSVRDKKEGYIFSNENGEPLIPMTCLRWLHGACEKSGLRKIGWHGLRHTFASHLAQNGVSILVIKELLGHADIKTTMRYSHLSTSVVKGAIDTLGRDIGHNMVTISNSKETGKMTPLPGKLEIVKKTNKK
jgi:integrase